MRIAFCVPSTDEVKADFWLSWTQLLIETLADRIEPAVLNVRTSLITNSRFQVVKDALRRECDKLLFIDSDMQYPGDSLRRLLAWNKPIVGATYVRRREPYGVLGYGIDDIPSGASGLWQMSRLPAGMMLVDASVFARVKRPWFMDEYRPETDDFVSEDFGFCIAARAAGYKIWCDLDLSHDLGHVGQMVYSWQKNAENS